MYILLFAKALQRLESCLSFNSKLCGKLFAFCVRLLDNCRGTPVAFFVADFNLLSCEFGKLYVSSVTLSHFKTEKTCRAHLQYFYSSL